MAESSSTETASTTTHPTTGEGRVCKAYKSLNDKLKDQCSRYRLFHLNDQFGAVPGMYKDHPEYEGEKMPDEKTSNYFCGGIINTIAVFEAFLIELLEEACTAGNGHTNKLTKTLKEELGKSKSCENIVLFKKWKELYNNCLLKDKNNNLLTVHLLDHPIKYHYVIHDEKIALIEIHKKPFQKHDNIEVSRRKRLGLDAVAEDESIICALLRLFYGIRCVMAHGDPKQTLEKYALKEFPKCSTGCCPGKKTEEVLQAASHLKYYHEKIKKKLSEDAKNMDKEIRRIPKKEVYTQVKQQYQDALEDEEWKDVFKIIDLYFVEPEAGPLPASFAFFHMCRVDQWLRDSKMNMYITYRLLVRVNQFIHMLAFRLTITVATILEEEHGLPPSGFWKIPVPKQLEDDEASMDEDEDVEEAITKDTIPNMIKRFEKRHKTIVTKKTKETPDPKGKNSIKKALEKATRVLKDDPEFKSNYENDIWVVEGADEVDIDDKHYVKTFLSILKMKK